jgi:predicted DCC family thiol-disulfide oxidoreductase YuxK
MPLLDHPPYSYVDDSNVPAFDATRPLFVFDGGCVLCSTGAAFLMRHDRNGRVALASAQSPLGTALYRHYGMEIDASYLLLIDGQAYTKSDGYFRLVGTLGGVWRLLELARIIPRPVRDWVYDRVAVNRYRWFGKAAYCSLLTKEQRKRLIDS